MPFRRYTNPYEFLKMEKWSCADCSFLVFVGYCRSGDTYLTGDVTDGVPVFSHSCRIGENLTQDQFDRLRAVHESNVKPLAEVDYRVSMLNRPFHFSETPHVEPNNRFTDWVLSFLF